MEKTKSTRWRVNKADLEKVGVGLLIALHGAFLTYVSQIILQTDFGAWTPIVVAGWSAIANLIRKWADGHQG